MLDMDGGTWFLKLRMRSNSVSQTRGPLSSIQLQPYSHFLSQSTSPNHSHLCNTLQNPTPSLQFHPLSPIPMSPSS
ncbi:hypothetical protein VNO77_16069 [Canavalia gladiata]|uniref:Uncharacterized protein n=1 Tax=Canavalia gladiata TaxID=3824 RepID=A0AAN9LZS9_CANGL